MDYEMGWRRPLTLEDFTKKLSHPSGARYDRPQASEPWDPWLCRSGQADHCHTGDDDYDKDAISEKIARDLRQRACARATLRCQRAPRQEQQAPHEPSCEASAALTPYGSACL